MRLARLVCGHGSFRRLGIHIPKAEVYDQRKKALLSAAFCGLWAVVSWYASAQRQKTPIEG